jgi:Cu(I)/Ag(I) efflux system membrane fusion protein
VTLMSTMTLNKGTWVAVAAMGVLVAAAAGYGVALWRGHAPGAPATPGQSTAVEAGSADSRKVLYWYDPMKPEARFDKPGKSPFMDMQLVPKYADAATGSSVQVDPRLAQSLGVRLATVTRQSVAGSIEAVGTLGFNERDVVVVQTRSGGFVERVYGHAPGDVVAAGAALADVLVPEWAGAQHEYLAVRATGDATLAAASRQRLLLLGMPEALVAEVERSGQARPVVTITSPASGVIQELMVRGGMSLAPMMTLARINGLGTLWLEVAVPEVHAALLAAGRPVQASLAAYPGELFSGRVQVVLPEANRETRTLRVRIELPNRAGKLRAGMYAQALIAGPREELLVVPSEAVIRTGERAVVFVAGDQPGRFSPVQVELGREVGAMLVVRKGLSAGQQVLASGQFLIDSEASMSGMVGRAAAPGASGAPGVSPTAALHDATGVIEAMDAAEVTLRHGPVPALKWPAMTMPFALRSAQQAAGLKAGDRVRFSFSEGASGPLIERMAKEPRP